MTEKPEWESDMVTGFADIAPFPGGNNGDGRRTIPAAPARTQSSHIATFLALFKMSWATQLKDRNALILLSSMMTLQNIMFFAIWMVFFAAFREFNGWRVENMAVLFGIVAFAYGWVFLIFGGALDLSRTIREGELDCFLGRPKSPLLSVLMRESRGTSIGDIVTGPFLWLVLGGQSVSDLPLLITLGFLAGLIYLAVAISVQSLSFFSSSWKTLPDQLFEVVVIISTVPQHGHALGMKVILFTLIPAGYAAYLPTLTVADFSWWKLGAMALAAIVWLTLAVAVFNRGLKQYTSGGGTIAPAR